MESITKTKAKKEKLARMNGRLECFRGEEFDKFPPKTREKLEKNSRDLSPSPWRGRHLRAWE